jgi:phospholipid/cholesterol/gamma-HCH transport system substrate-binding protein
MMPAAKRRRRALVIGVIAILAFAGSEIFALRSQYGIPGSTDLRVRAAFSDVGGLRVGDEVRIAGLRVGYVSDLSVQGENAVAELALQKVDTLYRNAEAGMASMGARSSMGQKYVLLDPGTSAAGEMAEGELIEATDSTEAEEVSELWEIFDKPTRTAVRTWLQEVGGGMAGHSTDIDDGIRAMPDFLPDTATMSRALAADGGADTVAMLSAMDRLAGRFEHNSQEIASLNMQLGKTLDAFAADGGQPLQRTLDLAPEGMRAERTALRALDRPLRNMEVAMRDHRPGFAALTDATPDLRGLLREGVPPMHKLSGVAEPADRTMRELTPMFHDIRPMVRQMRAMASNLRAPLAVLAPYAPEVSGTFTALKSVLSYGDANGHKLRYVAVEETPLVKRDPYPAPGEADPTEGGH